MMELQRKFEINSPLHKENGLVNEEGSECLADLTEK